MTEKRNRHIVADGGFYGPSGPPRPANDEEQAFLDWGEEMTGQKPDMFVLGPEALPVVPKGMRELFAEDARRQREALSRKDKDLPN